MGWHSVTWQGDLVTGRVYEFAKAVITDWVPETTEIYFLTLLESRNLRSRCQQGWFLLTPSFLG